MKQLKALFLTILCLPAFANSNLLLNNEGADLDFSKQLTVKKSLELDDPFVILLFSRWKALGALEPQANAWFDGIFAKNYEASLKALPVIKANKIQDLKKPVELYLLYRLGYFQTFLNEWITFTGSSNFLKTELGLALDQVVAPQSSLLILKSGLSLSEKQEKLLENVKDRLDSRLNISLQAFKALKTGAGAIEWIGRLPEDDIMRLHLAHTALLDYGRKGMLGASGKLIKKVVEPWIEKSENEEEIALYYMTLGRLLYQARAFKAASTYYRLIPDSSKYFLQAKTELLWVLLQTRDFSEAMGELATLKLEIFEDRFYPEVYLASAIGHTMLCQFKDARESIHQFVDVNKDWAQRISTALGSTNPPTIEENFYSKVMRKQLLSLKSELNTLKERKIDRYNELLNERVSLVKGKLVTESKRQWKNREKILMSALYKMKFVRIELLSRMRAVAEGLNEQLPTKDMVKRYEAAPVRYNGNQISFPSDGMLWADELFNMKGKVKNLCLQGKFYSTQGAGEAK